MLHNASEATSSPNATYAAVNAPQSHHIEFTLVNVQPPLSADLTNGSQSLGPSIMSIAAEPSASQTLSCWVMYLEGLKAIKHICDPVSDVLAVVGCIACGCLIIFIQEDRNNRPATRRDVVNARQERQRDAENCGAAMSMGYCIGNAVTDTAAIFVAMPLSAARAVCRTMFRCTQPTDTVFCVPRATVNKVDLFDSCESTISCVNNCVSGR